MNMGYVAGLFDCNGEIVVTQGQAILRVTLTGKLETVKEVSSKYYGRRFGKTVLLTGILAYKFLCAIRPYVKCSKAQVDYAIEQWTKRNAAKMAYDKLVYDSAKGLPARGC